MSTSVARILEIHEMKITTLILSTVITCVIAIPVPQPITAEELAANASSAILKADETSSTSTYSTPTATRSVPATMEIPSASPTVSSTSSTSSATSEGTFSKIESSVESFFKNHWSGILSAVSELR
ncbi:hypothetical protein DASC09_018120 [Saccharomycopsis crataegensis]|uniref:Uncharacterized protein n=1 Tax=Saccharomycopsis crataegensis TaxID=43959 RepID=A0AAV5QIQ6_9ASCO|nr:hypothetical protein DASC09_018120 [Saccharomycopsis crataegensis]